MQLLKSVAVAVKLKEPEAVAVPERTPAGLSVTPEGSAPEVTENVYGPTPPEAVSVALMGVPSGTLGRVEGLTVIAVQLASK